MVEWADSRFNLQTVVPYKVQEDGFIYGEFHRLNYAIVFAKALQKELGTDVSIHGPNGWEEYDG